MQRDLCWERFSRCGTDGKLGATAENGRLTRARSFVQEDLNLNNHIFPKILHGL